MTGKERVEKAADQAFGLTPSGFYFDHNSLTTILTTI